MQLLTTQAHVTRSEIFISDFELQAVERQSITPVAQRPRLKMVWHKEWDGKREHMVAQWVIAP